MAFLTGQSEKTAPITSFQLPAFRALTIDRVVTLQVRTTTSRRDPGRFSLERSKRDRSLMGEVSKDTRGRLVPDVLRRRRRVPTREVNARRFLLRQQRGPVQHDDDGLTIVLEIGRAHV